MDAYEPYVSLAVALGVGLLIGLEREQSADSDDGPAFLGGARTHPLFALAGGLAALLAQAFGGWVLVVVFLGVMSLTVTSYWRDVHGGGDRGMTSEVAFAVTFLLGALAVSPGIVQPTSRRLILVSAFGVATTVLLSAKPFLQRVIDRTSKQDVYAVLKFLVVSVIVLPLLPNQTYGPLDVINPYEVGLMVVLIAGIGFAGYVAVRLVGSGKGLALTGLIGGLVSSTSVTLSFAGRAKTQPELATSCAVAVVAASSIMFPRVLVEVAVVNPDLLPRLAYPVGGMAIGGAAASLFIYLRARARAKTERAPDVDFKNPFELGSAIKFGLIYAAVLLAAVAATKYLGTGGTYFAGILAGTTDVDAITLSMANQAKAGLDAQVAATTIVLGAASNTLVKSGMAITLGGWAFGRVVAAGLGVALVAGGVGLAVMWAVT